MKEKYREDNKKIKNYSLFVNSNSFLNESVNKIVDYLLLKMEQDKKEYKGDIPTKYNPGSKWSDYSWMVDEILQFLAKEYRTSYTLIKFGDKYDYDVIDDILKKNFKSEYERATELMNEFNMNENNNEFNEQLYRKMIFVSKNCKLTTDVCKILSKLDDDEIEEFQNWLRIVTGGPSQWIKNR